MRSSTRLSYCLLVASAVVILLTGWTGPAILADPPKNLALPVLGGVVVRFTSQYDIDNGVYHLVDDRTDTQGWRSVDGYLPQEFIFAFRGDQIALIDQVVLNPKTEHDPTTWPKVVKVSISAENPLDGFEEVGQFTLTQDPSDQAFPIGRRARFVKLRILENFGGAYTSLGEVKLLESSAEDYESILLKSLEATAASHSVAASLPIDETGVALEIEPNGTPVEANPLRFGQRIKGVIDPLGEKDYFRFSVPGNVRSVLTLELSGQPNIRTSLTLFDAAGRVHERFNPGRLPAQHTTFSWEVGAGDHFVKVTEPPVSIVLIWDTSGSMEGSTDDLQRAVESYIDQVRPTERLNLIRFSAEEAEVLLPTFTNDWEQLKAATQEKFFAVGGTPLYDAIAKGLQLLEGAEGNRAIIVMTDGDDTGSHLTHPDFWQILEEKRIRLYTIGLGWALQEYVHKIASSGDRFLAHAAMATNGRYFFARTSDELKGFYQQIADELRTVSTYYLQSTLSQGSGSLNVVATGERSVPVSAPPQIELILDASRSMWGRIDGGRTKIDVAKDVMAEIIESLPDDVRVSLRLYGHRTRPEQPGACQDSELVSQFAKIDKSRLLERVHATRLLGSTPLAYSLQQVVRDFGDAPGEKVVILVTDGVEECGGSPSAAVSELLEQGFKVLVNVVGLELADEATKREMQRVAELTSDHLFDPKATDTAVLHEHEAFEQSLMVPYDVLDASGAKVEGGLIGQEAINLPEGVYTVVVHAAAEPITISDVRITHDQSTTVELQREGQEIGIRILGPEDG
ncbi:MAG: VWA domain-containing protein [Candidatus Bipolaricaulia bacterium]